MKLERINIAVKPSGDVARAAIEISNKIAEQDSALFVLDNASFFPHITLYSPAFPTKNVQRVLENTAGILKKHRAFEAKVWTIRSTDGYIDVALVISPEWKKLHADLVEGLNPYREGHLRPEYQVADLLSQYSQQKQDYIHIYGYENVYETFIPHLTFTRLKSEEKAYDLANVIEFPLNSIIVESVAAYSMGENGTCTGILKEYSL